MLDETDVYFESPVFFDDTVENGRTADYRIYSIDILGRRSEYPEVCSLRVEKVTPPNAPSAASPELIHTGKRGRPSATADDLAGSAPDSKMSSAARIVSNLNPNKRGIVLPVFTDSPDTVRFTIYRAKAVDAEEIGPPQIIADLKYDNPKADALDAASDGSMSEAVNHILVEDIRPESYKTSSTWTGFLKRTRHAQLKDSESSQPDLIYFDANIEEGCTYKYWISAWDSWSNESAWSQSVSIGVPTDIELKHLMNCLSLCIPGYWKTSQ